MLPALLLLGLNRVAARLWNGWISRGFRERLDGLTVARLSDLHYDSPRVDDVIRSAVALTNQLAPDLIVLTGDYVTAAPLVSRSRARVALDAEPCAQILGDLMRRWASSPLKGRDMIQAEFVHWNDCVVICATAIREKLH